MSMTNGWGRSTDASPSSEADVRRRLRDLGADAEAGRPCWRPTGLVRRFDATALRVFIEATDAADSSQQIPGRVRRSNHEPASHEREMTEITPRHSESSKVRLAPPHTVRRGGLSAVPRRAARFQQRPICTSPSSSSAAAAARTRRPQTPPLGRGSVAVPCGSVRQSRARSPTTAAPSTPSPRSTRASRSGSDGSHGVGRGRDHGAPTSTAGQWLLHGTQGSERRLLHRRADAARASSTACASSSRGQRARARLQPARALRAAQRLPACAR